MEQRPDRIAGWEELARRTSNGVEVTLFWQRGHEDVHVRVIDAGTDEAFELTVPGEIALETFYHPYAYGAQPSSPHRAVRKRCLLNSARTFDEP
jgi:hypothetical protein